MKRIVVIDSFGLFFRLYYAMMNLRSKDGKPSGMISGFASFVQRFNHHFKADYAVFALEGSGKTFRHEIYPSYKANRSKAPDELKEQIPVCIEMIEKMGFCACSFDGYEADDIIASIATKYGKDYEVRIFSGDKDLFALIENNVCMVDPKTYATLDAAACYEKYGVYPHQMKDYLSILGDSSDNVPGIKGIGERGARTLLAEFGTLENAINNAESIANNRLKNLLLEGSANVGLSASLIDLKRHLAVPEIDSFEIPQNPLLKVRDILERYDLSRVLSSISENSSKNSSGVAENSRILEFQSIMLNDENELNSVLSSINENSIIAFDTETTGLDSKSAKIVGFSFALANDENKAYYVPLNHNYLGAPKQIGKGCAKSAIERIFSACVVGHNLKYDFEIIRNNFGIKAPANYADTLILAWLDDPEKKCNMDDLALRLFNHSTIKFESVVPKDGNFGDVEVESATKYASEDAFVTLRFYEYFKGRLNENLWDIAKNVEFPFIRTLIELESSGILASYEKLSALNERISTRILELQKEIWRIAGSQFNINSPKQLGAVLFEHLGLPSGKKTKSGYSTDESVLSGLTHEIIAPLLEYRELAKLKGTYTEPFMRLAKSGERIHTHFMHTGTATGRLSSHSPNLQNIPARGALAKDVRNCFIASDGYDLISLDYSQIELRLLAHFSGDACLCTAFKNKEDIHARTAISIFGSSEGNNRAVAKSINFGLIYGMGSSRLAANLGIKPAQAKEYIEKYFASFPTIKSYLASIKSFAVANGFVSTLLGRKRLFDFASANERTKALFEREAVNSVFQGSAADIIKLAMNKIMPLLDENHKMILQIHDELIFEVKSENSSAFAQKIASIMENVVELQVPLLVNYEIAKSWGELK